MESVIEVDGIALHIEGDGEDAILMVHGWPDTYRLWDRQVAALRGRYRCARFTLPGFDPAGPRRPAGLDETVELLRRMARAASPERRVILMLHDWGCLFGYQFYMRYPALVAKIVAVDVGDAASPEYLGSLGAAQKLMLASYQGWLALAWRVGGRAGDGMARLAARLLQAPSRAEDVSANMGYPYDIAWTGSHGSYRAAKPLTIGCPFLYLYGTRKPLQFQTEQWLRALAHKPGCAVVAMDAGHWPMVRQPGPFNHAVATWLAGH